jgi:hypothetical protein
VDPSPGRFHGLRIAFLPANVVIADAHPGFPPPGDLITCQLHTTRFQLAGSTNRRLLGRQRSALVTSSVVTKNGAEIDCATESARSTDPEMGATGTKGLWVPWRCPTPPTATLLVKRLVPDHDEHAPI